MLCALAIIGAIVVAAYATMLALGIYLALSGFPGS
jgi:hypothetical protein